MSNAAESWSAPGQEVISFGPFRLVPKTRRLTLQGGPVKLGARALDILLVLLEKEGEVVGSKELLARVWPGLFVEEVSLRVHVAALRKALDTGDGGSSFLKNVPGRGYCFSARVSRARAEEPAAPAAPLYPLPQPLSQMVGRDEDVRNVCLKAGAEGLVTIAGSGGIGKTTVALAVGHALLESFDGAVCFVDLSRVFDPDLLARAVATACGLTAGLSSPVPALASHLNARPTLLILDNCEHLVSKAAWFAEQLLAGAQDLHILATSREVLRAANEHVYRLGSLESPPANARLSVAQIIAFPSVKLFVDRLASSGSTIAIDGSNAPIVGSICRKLDGVALAIELAAGNAGTLGLKQTASLLDSQFALRWPGRRTAPPRHQTINATLDWSYNLLPESEKKVLRRLAVFVGEFSLAAAQGVVAGADVSVEAVYEAVTGLLSKSLVAADKGGNGFRLLETTRAYAASALRDAGEEHDHRRRHAQYIRDQLTETAAAPTGTFATLRPGTDIDNIRSALRWAFGPNGDQDLAVALAARSGAVWLARGQFAECAEWMAKARAALKATRQEGSELHLVILIAAISSMTLASGFSGDVKEEWVGALNLAMSLNNVQAQMFSYLALWALEERAPLFADSLKRARGALDVARKSPDPGEAAMAYWMMGTSERHLGRLENARVHLQRSLDIDTEQSRAAQLRSTGYDRRVDAMTEMATLLWLQGFADRAADLGARAISEARALGVATPLSTAMTWPCLIRLFADPDIDAVEREIVDLLEHARSHAAVAYEGFGLGMLGLCQARRGEFDAAVPLVSKGLELLAKAHYGVAHTIIRTNLCEAAVAANQPAYARSLMAVIDAENRNPELWCNPEILRVKGLLALANGEREAAETCLRQSIALAREQGALSWELRSAMDLGRLQASSQRREGAELVARAYRRFTEGFTTLDLISARRLMDEWRVVVTGSAQSSRN